MSLLRSERAAATALVLAAALGLALANSPLGPQALALAHLEVGLAGTPLHLSLAHWAGEGLLAVFFLVAAIELRHELTLGSLNSAARALRPAIAAAGGVIVPILVFLAVTAGSGQERGWPIPTATDIAFALGVLALVGKGLPPQLRAFLLALAILDDVVGILLIATVFAGELQALPLTLALLGTAAFAMLGVALQRRMGRSEATRRQRAGTVGLVALMAAIGLGVWAATLASGVHATIAGVALGLALAPGPARRLRHALEPAVNALVLPAFALSASLVVVPAVPLSQLQPAFWGIALALPVGKLVGIAGAAFLADRLLTRDRRRRMSGADLLAAGSLGGIGFTVSLLMVSLAYAGEPLLVAEGTLAVLLGSTLALLASILAVGRQAAYYRRLRRLRAAAAARVRRS